MNFFGVKEFFRINFDFKNWCKNEFKDNNEKSCSWSKKGFLTKSISETNGRATAMPTALELISHFCRPLNIMHLFCVIVKLMCGSVIRLFLAELIRNWEY